MPQRMDLIRIKGLELDCIVGVRPLEREREQRVRIDLALGLDTRPAGRSGRIALTCDYDRIAEQVITLLRFRHYHLIEMATEELAAMLLGTHDAIEMVEVHLDKPAALDGRARAASIEIRRDRSDFPSRVIASSNPRMTALLETREAGLYHLELGPETILGADALRSERELDWIINGSLFADGNAVPTVSVREGGARRGALRAGAEGAVIFRCTSPPAEP